MKWTSDALAPGADAALFGRRQRRPRGPRVPVTVVTGFLGAGKTTLIRAFLECPEGAGTAVVVNEYGEVGIDDALLRASAEATVLLGNGCLCCNVRTDLQETLRSLFADRARGAVPSFSRIVIETSGLADPGPVLQTFASDRALGEEFHLQGLVTVVDAVTGGATVARSPEAKKQVALADRIVVTKSDLAGAGAVEALLPQLRAFGAAPVHRAVDGRIDPAVLTEDALERVAADLAAPAAHSHDITTFALTFDAPLAWPALSQAIAVLTQLRGPDLLRVKGIVALRECRGPVVVHVVQHVAHKPVELEDWPDGDHRSRLVFITRNLPQAPVAQLFAALGSLVQFDTKQ